MSKTSKLTISKLLVEGPAKPPAAIDLFTGLNAIVGASDTGKSYIFSAIDYLFGASTIPKTTPHSQGYNRGWLQLSLINAVPITIERVFGEEEVNLQETEQQNVSFSSVRRRIRSSHQTNSIDSLSHILLERIGLANREVKRNKNSAKMAVTFRHLAHLTMIDEEKIITTRSPALSGQFTLTTAEEGVFSLFLTGGDDSALTSVTPDKKLRNASLDGEIALIQRLLSDKTIRLQRLAESPDELEERLVKVAAAVDQGTAIVSATKERIAALEAQRKEVWQRTQAIADRRLVLSEQIKRLQVLHDYYKSDRQRLTAVSEAGHAFEKLPSGECAVCGRINQQNEAPDLADTFADFQAACLAEIKKINELSLDLSSTIAENVSEEENLGREANNLRSSRSHIDEELESQLKPQHQTADTSLAELIRLRADLSRAKDLKDEIASLNGELQTAETSKKAKIPTTKSTARVDTRTAQDFCEIVSTTLKAWKYPLTGTVAFDPSKFDLVIGNQDRGSMGKGYRAITHAAFTISLMRYCRLKNLPHPGFVILDSPLNPFRGAALTVGPDAAINQEIKEAFYVDLAADDSSDQYIILENTEPPTSLVDRINYIQFTGNPSAGRSGFFPVS